MAYSRARTDLRSRCVLQSNAAGKKGGRARGIPVAPCKRYLRTRCAYNNVYYEEVVIHKLSLVRLCHHPAYDPLCLPFPMDGFEGLARTKISLQALGFAMFGGRYGLPASHLLATHVPASRYRSEEGREANPARALPRESGEPSRAHAPHPRPIARRLLHPFIDGLNTLMVL